MAFRVYCALRASFHQKFYELASSYSSNCYLTMPRGHTKQTGDSFPGLRKLVKERLLKDVFEAASGE